MYEISKENFFSVFKGKPFSALQKLAVLITTVGYLLFAYLFTYPFLHEDSSASLHIPLSFVSCLFLLIGFISTITFSILKNRKKKIAYQCFKRYRSRIETDDNLKANESSYRKMIKEYITIYGFFYQTKRGKIKSGYKFLTFLYGLMIFVSPFFVYYVFKMGITYNNQGNKSQGMICFALTIIPIILFLIYLEIFIDRIYKQRIYFEKGSVYYNNNNEIEVDFDEKFVTWIQNEPRQKIYRYYNRISHGNLFTYIYSFPSSALLIGIPLIFVLLLVFIIAWAFSLMFGAFQEGIKYDSSSYGGMVFENVKNAEIDPQKGTLIDADTGREYQIYNYSSYTGYFEDENRYVYYLNSSDFTITGKRRYVDESVYEADKRIRSEM